MEGKGFLALERNLWYFLPQKWFSSASLQVICGVRQQQFIRARQLPAGHSIKLSLFFPAI